MCKAPGQSTPLHLDGLGRITSCTLVTWVLTYVPLCWSVMQGHKLPRWQKRCSQTHTDAVSALTILHRAIGQGVGSWSADC